MNLHSMFAVWKSKIVVKSYVTESMCSRVKVARQILNDNEIKSLTCVAIEKFLVLITPLTSKNEETVSVKEIVRNKPENVHKTKQVIRTVEIENIDSNLRCNRKGTKVHVILN